MRTFLRAETAALHQRVDAAFARYPTGDRAGYADMLVAHARALPAAEAALAGQALPGWRSRIDALRRDLDQLGRALPTPLPFAQATGGADAFGILYVLEGSRLGGVMIARDVPPGLPTGYLTAAHRPGEWRALVARIEREAEAGGDAWRRAALAGATRTFALFERAAQG